MAGPEPHRPRPAGKRRPAAVYAVPVSFPRLPCLYILREKWHQLYGFGSVSSPVWRLVFKTSGRSKGRL